MPLNLGYFIIRKPRVSPINAISTLPPTDQGTFSLLTAFTIKYVGTATSALLSITGEKFLTLINETQNHSDNLEIAIIGKTIKSLVDEINTQHTNYQATLLTNDVDLCFLKGTTLTDINNADYTVMYNVETEYLIDVCNGGKLGNCSVSWKKNNFIYSNENSKWMIDTGYIYDAIDVAVDSLGVANIGFEGVQIKFFPAIDSASNDLSRKVFFNDVELVQSLDSPTAQIAFPAAPILKTGTLVLKINQVPKVENKDYQVGYGTSAEIKATIESPYYIPASNNILKVRINNDLIQEFIIPEGLKTAQEIANVVNQASVNFIAYSYRDLDKNKDYFSLITVRGTFYNQIRIEDGSINSVFGYTYLQASKGEGNGTISFLTYVPNEDVTPAMLTDTVQVSASSKATGNSFLGINLDNFELLENSNLKTKNIDYLLDTSGTVNFITKIVDEQLLSGVLKLDNSLFPPSYKIYDNGNLLVEETDYTVNPQGGWITLATSAFPSHIFSADYTSSDLGVILNEIILGNPAEIQGSVEGPYNIINATKIFILSVNNQADQIFTLPVGSGVITSEIVDLLNGSGQDFIAYNNNNKLFIKTKTSGPLSSILIKDGSANTILGFSNNQAVSGSGAKGGEQALSVINPPMKITGFTAPQDGNIIIIKNNDVTSRYKSGTIINIGNEYYQVANTSLETNANLIGSYIGPYTILKGSNDIFNFTVDDGSENTVTFTAGVNIPILDIVLKINEIYPNTSEVINLNGMEKIKLKASTKIKIGNGTANRTFGFEKDAEDTNLPDSYIKITSKFMITYVDPDMYTTINPIPLDICSFSKLEVPQNSNVIKFIGDVTSILKTDVLIKIDGLNFYKIKNSTLSDGVTEVTLDTKITSSIYPDTLIENTAYPVFKEGDNLLQTQYLPVLSETLILKKNETQILELEKDFTITDSGSIELIQPMLNGDNYTITYTAKRFIDNNTSVLATYTYYDYLVKGTNIKISFEADNPDDFYIHVLHASTFMSSFKKELTEKNQQIANSSSSGFPTGEIPVTKNEDSGSSSYQYNLGDIQDKINLSQAWYSYFDNRLNYFETERYWLSGYTVGAENGRVTQADVENSANIPPTRLFPIPDTRPEEQKVEPLRVPALDGLNKNDAGSSTHGWASSNMQTPLNSETSYINSEISKLNTLLGRSITNHTLSSSGSFNFISVETMSLYVETKNPGLQQRTVSVSFSPNQVVNPSPPPPTIYIPQSAYYIASQINSAVNSSFGYTVNPASVSGAHVVLTANSSGLVQCCYIVSDAPNVGFGTGSEAAIRSRSVLWTGGYSYSGGTVPGSFSVHLNIVSEDSQRNTEITEHNTQIIQLTGQMEEWLPPFDISFPLSKTEKDKAINFISITTTMTSISNSFDDLKSESNGHVFDSINSNTTLNNRITVLNLRKTDITTRVNGIISRDSEIISILTSESLFEPRYDWLIILTHRENGYYANEKIAINQEAKRQREAINNTNILNTMQNF